MKSIKKHNSKYIDEVTLKEVEEAIKKARVDGWESEDGFLLATGFNEPAKEEFNKRTKRLVKKITNTIKDWYWCNAHDRGLMEDIVEMIKEKAGKELKEKKG
jgi:hypothetical protein